MSSQHAGMWQTAKWDIYTTPPPDASEMVEIRRVTGTSDYLHDLVCVSCDRPVKTKRMVLSLICAEAGLRVVIHLDCLDERLMGLEAESEWVKHRTQKAANGLIKMAKDLVAKGG